MFARVFSGALLGVEAFVIEVEVDCCAGLGQISIVGLPDFFPGGNQGLLLSGAAREKVAGQSRPL
jgi:hypothetical protein